MASQVVRYKKPIPFLSPYIVETQIVGVDSKWIYLNHQFRSRKGALYTQLLVKTVIKESSGAKRTIEPERFLLEMVGPDMFAEWKELQGRDTSNFRNIVKAFESLDYELSVESKNVSKEKELEPAPGIFMNLLSGINLIFPQMFQTEKIKNKV